MFDESIYRGSGWDHREAEPDYIDSLDQQGIGHLPGKTGITEHYRNNRVNPIADFEAGCGNLRPEETGVLLKSVTQLGSSTQALKNRNAGGNNRRRYRV